MQMHHDLMEREFGLHDCMGRFHVTLRLEDELRVSLLELLKSQEVHLLHPPCQERRSITYFTSDPDGDRLEIA